MAGYDAYQSALHAMHVVLQATKGFDYACEKLDPLWVDPLPRDTCTAPVLAKMLTDAGVPATSLYVIPIAIPARAVEVGRQRRLLVFETRIYMAPKHRRWGVTHMWDGKSVHWVEVISPGDEQRADLAPQDTCTGWVVEVLAPVLKHPEIVGHVVQPPPYRPSYN